MPAPMLMLVDIRKRGEMLSDARVNGRLLLTSPLNGDEHDYVAAYELENGHCRVFAVQGGFLLHVWDIVTPDAQTACEQAVAFTLIRNGWGEVLDGKWRVK